MVYYLCKVETNEERTSGVSRGRGHCITIYFNYLNKRDFMEVKTLQVVLVERSVLSKDGQRQPMYVALPTGRKRYDFRSFCNRVAKSSSFSPQEVAAVLNLSTEVAKEVVSEGNIVEFGDLGTLCPSIRSKAVPLGEKYRAQEHISHARVKLIPSKKYFSMPDVRFEVLRERGDEIATAPGSPSAPSDNSSPGAGDSSSDSGGGGRF